MAKLKILLQEDDCAPDAYQYFELKFKELIGITVSEYKNTANKIEFCTELWYETDTHLLGIDSGDPYWTLYEKDSE